jgi:CRISPR-associated endonuclease/helicase Cas3
VVALKPQERLMHLEHARMRAQMLPQPAVPAPTGGRNSRGPLGAAPQPKANASTWWKLPPKDALLTGLLQQEQPFRDDAGQREVVLVLLPDEDGEKEFLHQVFKLELGERSAVSYPKVDIQFHTRLPNEATQGDRITPWGVTDYMAELQALAESMDMDLLRCAQRFGTVNVIKHEAGWVSHPAVGFWKKV